MADSPPQHVKPPPARGDVRDQWERLHPPWQRFGAQLGLSISEVSGRASVMDPGQISKLPNRLAGIGLVEQCGQGPPHRKANAWRLTGKGRECLLALPRF